MTGWQYDWRARSFDATTRRVRLPFMVTTTTRLSSECTAVVCNEQLTRSAVFGVRHHSWEIVRNWTPGPLDPVAPFATPAGNTFLPVSNAKRNKSVIFVLRVPHFSVLHFPSRIFSRGHVIWFWLISVEHSSWSHNTSCCATEYKKLNCGRDSAPRSEKWTHWARLLSLTACNYKI